MDLIRQDSFHKYDINQVINDYKQIRQTVSLRNGQVAVQHAYGSSDEKYRSCNRLSPTDIYSESDFNIINSFAKDTVFEKILSDYPTAHRARLMELPPGRCYSIHVDGGIRCHLAIETYPECMFLFPEHNFIKHIPADGHVYFMNSSEKHTFINGATEPRIHFIFNI